MKLLFGLLVSLAISSAFALPAHLPKDEVDVVELPRGLQTSQENDDGANVDDTDIDPDYKNFKGVVDTGAGYPFLAPLPQPFSFNLGFFEAFEDILGRLRTRLWSSGPGESSEEDGFSMGLDPTKGGNKTSVIKVIDGHKIEINDTVYGNGDDSGGAIFKFRVINIRPLESDEEVSEGTLAETQAPTTEIQNTPPTRDIEGKSDEDSTSNEEDNEINANVDDPESTTEAITTEMLDTVPHRIPSSDNNAVDNDNPVNPDELQVDSDAADLDVVGVTTESLDTDVAIATLTEDNPNPAGNTIKSEKLSALVDPENVNDANQDEEKDEDAEQSTESTTKNDEDDGEREFNESISENQNSEEIEAVEELLEQQQKLKEILAGKQMQELVETVGEQLSMADDKEERFADEVEEMLSVGNDDEEGTVQKTEKLSNVEGHHSLREDLSSSDDEEDAEDVNNASNQGLNSEWGSLDDNNVLTNEIDVYEKVPIDLSNDIAINDIMADQGAPVDPDAEVLDLQGFQQNPKESDFAIDIK